MKLIEQLKNKVPSRIFQRGKKYYKLSKIKDYYLNYIAENKYEIKARVKGNYIYQVKITVEIVDNSLYFENSCTCPYDWGTICKHEVAVLYQFLEEDYESLDEKSSYNNLLNLTKELKKQKLTPLNYYIKGFLSENMVNFKLSLESDLLDLETLNEVMAYAHNPDSTYYDLEYIDNYLLKKDKVNINYLAKIDTRKSRSDASLLFAKNRNNFNFLFNLIENNQVYFAENNQEIKTGEKLYPTVKLSGNEKEVEFDIIKKGEIYESKEEFNKVFWIVDDNKIKEYELSEANKLPEKVKIPEEEEAKFLFEILEELKNKFNLLLPESIKEHNLLEYLPKIKLKFDAERGNILCYTEVKIANKTYMNSEILNIDPDKREYERLDENKSLWGAWKVKECAKLIKFLEEYNFHVSKEAFKLKEDLYIQEFLDISFDNLPEHWEIETTDAFDNLEVKEVELEPIIEFEEVEESDEINWFEFNISYNLGGKTYPRDQIRDMIRYNNKGQAYVKIDNNYFILNEGEKEKDINKALDLAKKDENGKYKSHFYNLLYYKNLLEESGIEFKGNKVYNQLEEDISNNSLVKKEKIPEEVKNKLRDYQKEGYYWFKFLDKYNFAGILADDMGLGKTVQSLSFLKSKDSDKAALIVCPRTLINNWGEEIDKFFSDIDYLVYHSSPEKRDEMRKEFSDVDIIITSYSIISRDHKELKDYVFSSCILDEAQKIKNHRTKRARGVKKIKAHRKLALTGTPLENSLEELWSIFDFLMPGYLGNYNRFRKEYLNPIKKENNEKKLIELKKRVAPFILRRKKEEVLSELPEKVINVHKVDMNSLQEDTYKEVLEELKINLEKRVAKKGFNKSRINVLSALTKLRQICNHPSLVLNSLDDNHSSGKVDALLELVEDAKEGEHKIIIFSQFVQMLKIIKDRFESKKISYEYLDGSTRNRMEKVRNFNKNKNIDTFLISLKAGGTGLNLTSADIVIHVDPWWNPMVERQASDRAHRIGQDKRVFVYKLITRGTVEEKMIKLQKKKKNIFDKVIENNSNPIESITWQDIQELLNYN
ncbi:MAG: SNF2-related protein [Bacillota bacterium]